MLTAIIAILIALAIIVLGALATGAILFIVVNLIAVAFGLAGITYLQALAIGVAVSFVSAILKDVLK